MDDVSKDYSGFKHSNPNPVFNDVVTQCLTKRHEECRGWYANELLGLKLTCRCPCHSEDPEAETNSSVALGGISGATSA